jgi:hypothetical protein
MAHPDLLGGGSTDRDTQVAYPASGMSVGTVGILSGSTYVWCSYTGSTALVAGEPVVAADLKADTKNLDLATTGLGVGQTKITGITPGATAIPAGTFDEGYMVVVDGAGEGTIYRIRHSSAFSASTADGEITLYDFIKVASDANTQVSLVQNKFAGVRKSTVYPKNAFVGIPNVAVPAGDSTTQYFWAQRNGYCPAFIEDAPARGTAVCVSIKNAARLRSVVEDVELVESTSGGARHVIPLDKELSVGVMVTDAIDGEVQIVDLQNPIF